MSEKYNYSYFTWYLQGDLPNPLNHLSRFQKSNLDLLNAIKLNYGVQKRDELAKDIGTRVAALSANFNKGDERLISTLVEEVRRNIVSLHGENAHIIIGHLANLFVPDPDSTSIKDVWTRPIQNQ